MSVTALYFTAPGELELRDRALPAVGPGTVVVETDVSAISSGTERLVYRGDAPDRLETDGPVRTLVDDLSYPTRYGYAAAGRVIEAGEAVDEAWLGRRVFAYNPHETGFTADPETLVPVPETVPQRHAPLLASAETAVNFLLDGQPAIGERVAVFGQGPVGLLTTAMLAEMPLDCLVAVDPIDQRRALASDLGADVTVDPRTYHGPDRDRDGLRAAIERRAGLPDLTVELSGDPSALDDAMAVTGFDGRVVVGSWYGTKSADLDFGGRFHRHRLDIRSSQVSTIAPRHQGRWSRTRRHEVAWERLADLPVDPLLTHELPFERAPEAYELLEQSPEEAVQVLLSYDA
jgi:2-desacetyl-2-hydroxyethyl bacteriochlorophyllide A dehydrogenase